MSGKNGDTRRRRSTRVDVSADVNVVVSTGTPGGRTRSRSQQSVVVNQRRGTRRPDEEAPR